MKNFTLFLYILVLTLFISGCQEPEPNKEIYIEKPSQKLELQEEQKEEQTEEDNNKILENFTVENKYNRVFTECFTTGSIALKKSCKKKIDAFLKSAPLRMKRKVLIEVHTDKGGKDEYNHQISQKRAKSVAGSLYYKEYKHSKVYYRGFGEEKPLYKLRSKEADSANRRIVMHLKPKEVAVEKAYRLYKKEIPKQIKKTKKQKKKRVKVQKVNLKKYTGKADTGWIYFGKKELAKKFDISCTQDSLRKVRNRSIKGHKKAEFMHGLHKKSLRGSVGTYTFTMLPISVFENGYVAKKSPNIILTNPNQKKTVLTTDVNTYNGEKGMLYRVFVNKRNSAKNNMECMDMVFSYTSGDFKYGVAYFKEKNRLVQREIKLK